MIFFSNLCLQVFQKWYAWTISEVSRTNKHNFLLQPANINLCVWLMETVWRQLVRLHPAVFRNLAVFLWSGISGWSALKIWKHILMAALFLDAHHCYMWSFPVFVCVCVCRCDSLLCIFRCDCHTDIITEMEFSHLSLKQTTCQRGAQSLSIFLCFFLGSMEHFC